MTYRRDLTARFANGRIAYPLSQIADDGLSKLRSRVVPIVEAAIAAGESGEAALTVIAAWVQWLGGVSDVTAVDASAGERTSILMSRTGADRTRALMELLAPGSGSREELVGETERLRVDFGRGAV